jgi:hypothetical protein
MSQKIYRLRVVIALIPLCTLMAGCGVSTTNTSTYVNVSGALMAHGEPAVNAVIRFIPTESGRGPGIPKVCSGAVVQSDGSFRASHDANQVGLVPGKYHMLVLWMNDSDQGLLHDRLKGRFADAERPFLTIEVQQQAVDLGQLELFRP